VAYAREKTKEREYERGNLRVSTHGTSEADSERSGWAHPTTVITSSFNKESDWTKRSRDVFLWSTDVAAVAQTALNLRMPLRTVAAELSVLHYEEIERSTHRTLVQVLMGPEHLKANHQQKAGKAKVKRSRLEARARVAECLTPRAGTLAWYHV